MQGMTSILIVATLLGDNFRLNLIALNSVIYCGEQTAVLIPR